jgi:hypothetical protein
MTLPIEQYFKDEDSLNGLIELYYDLFERIQKYEKDLKDGRMDTDLDMQTGLKELASIFSSLNVVYHLASFFETQQKNTFYIQKKIELEKSGTKYSETSLKTEAHHQANSYVRITSIFGAYRESCEKLIYVLQTSLNNLHKEKYS